MATSPRGSGLHVLIIGAGITGLLLAQGLKKHGIPFTIYESEATADVNRFREWGMSIQWALPLLPRILPDELMEKLQSASVDPHYIFPDSGNFMPVTNGETGESIAKVPLTKMIRVSRRRMRALCAEGIAVNYAKAFSSLDATSDDNDNHHITISFTDGTTATGSLVIGADGANSLFRNAIFPHDQAGLAAKIPYGGANLHVCYNDASVAQFLRSHLTPVMALGVHPAGYWLWLSIQDIPDPDPAKANEWVFQLQWTYRTDRPDLLKPGLAELDLGAMREIARETFGEPYKTAWTKIPVSVKMPSVNRVSVWEPRLVSHQVLCGKVALVGDAAHAMSFHRGQGLNHGVADVVKLVESLAEVNAGTKGQKEAVVEYEEEMVKRAGEEVRVSRMNTEMMHDWQKFRQSPFMQRGGDRNK